MYSVKSLQRRILALFVCVIFALTLVAGRLYFIQAIQGKDLQLKASDQWLRDLPLSAKRGDIVDRNGVTLASSYSVYDVYIRPALVENAESEASIYSNVLNLEYNEVLEKLKNRSVSETLLTTNIPKETLNQLIATNLKSFNATENWTRSYLYDSLLSQILGFTTTDGVGQSGIELYYDNLLAGVDGSSMVEGDAGGKEIHDSETYYIPPINGVNIELTIDFGIQSAVETIMRRAIMENGSKSGSALVVNPKTGEILSVVTLPSLNLNEIDRENTDELFSLSRSFLISDTYEPGSTFKTIVAGIALDLGLVNEHTGFYCPGYMIIDGVRANCHKKTGHGSQTLMSGFCNSCNCVFMQVASMIGMDNFYKYLGLFGLDNQPKIDYPSVAQSLIIPRQDLTTNDFYRNGFGHSIAISGLQLMMAISALVTDGYLLTPYLLKRAYLDDGENLYLATKQISNKAVNPSVVDVVRRLMKNVVEKGGGKASQVEGVSVGGKTGTAQKIENGVTSKEKYIGSYICYSPIEDPRYGVLVIFDEPKSSIYGNIVATPVAGEILREIYKLEGNASLGSQEGQKVVVPDVKGKSLTEAGAILASAGLYYVTEGEGTYVTYQSLKAGDEVALGSSIMIRFE